MGQLRRIPLPAAEAWFSDPGIWDPAGQGLGWLDPGLNQHQLEPRKIPLPTSVERGIFVVSELKPQILLVDHRRRRRCRRIPKCIAQRPEHRQSPGD